MVKNGEIFMVNLVEQLGIFTIFHHFSPFLNLYPHSFHQSIWVINNFQKVTAMVTDKLPP